MSTADGAEWARSKGMLFLEASAKTEKCVQQVFNEVVQKVGVLMFTARAASW